MDSNDLVARIEGELGSSAGREATTPLHPPPKVADHSLVRRIGAGSYGEVWLAVSVTGQWRAVKAVSRDRFSSDRPYEREFRGVIQFEPISRSHASLVQVLHVGRDDEARAFYYVMELADPATSALAPGPAPETAPSDTPAASRAPAGLPDPEAYIPRTLRSDLKTRGRLPVSEAVVLGVELAGALGHVHRHGLVHRDVKPSNVIYVQGRPKLADLGLVTHRSEARSFVGTEGFIPPEGPGTPKADLFALGRLLYEAVTGKDRCEFPELPADLDAWPDRGVFLEFNEVVTRLCAPDPGRRYANAAEVAGDLNLILAGRSVRRANGIERRLQQARRILAMTLIGLALLAGVVWFQQARQEEAESRAAHEQVLRERAESAERASQQQLYTALLEQARATVRGGELGQRVKALDAIRRAASLTNTAELRREALTALGLPDLRSRFTLRLGQEFTGREPDPEFNRIATCSGRGPVVIQSLPDLAELASLAASTNLPCYGLRWSPDGRFLAAKRDYPGGTGADIELWNLGGEPRRVGLFHKGWYDAWTFHPTRPEFVIVTGPGTIASFDLESGRERERLQTDVTPTILKFSPDGNLVAAAYRRTDGWGVSIHPAGRTNVIASHVFDSFIGSVEWHPDGRSLAITDFLGGVHLMNPASGDLRLLGRHRAEAVEAVFDPRGDYLLSGGWDRSILCWDLRSGQRAFNAELDTWASRFSRDGSTVAVLRDSQLEFHAFERPSAARETTLNPAARVRHAAFSPDGRWLAASTDAGLNVCDLQTGQTVSKTGAGPRLFWNPESTELFGSGSAASRWRVRPGPDPHTPPTLEPIPMPRPSGFASLCVASNQAVWTAAEGSLLTDLKNLEPEGRPWTKTVRGMSGQSPDGRWTAIYQANSPYLHVYQLPSLQRVAIITNLPRVSGFSFSPSGRELAVVSRGHAEFFRTDSWQRTRTCTNVIGIQHVGCLFQPDEQGVWLGHSLRSSGLHDASSFELLLPLPQGQFPLALSHDGRQLAASDDARRIVVWNLATARRELRDLGLDWTPRPRHSAP